VFWNKQKGSIVVEASIILPIFLCFFLYLLTMIQLVLVELSLEHSLTLLTKRIATNYQALISEIKENGSSDEELKDYFQPLLDQSVDPSIIRLEHLQLSQVKIPRINTDGSYALFSLRYDMPLSIPFIEHTVTIRKDSWERVWIGMTEEESEEGIEQALFIDSINSPVQRGKKLKIIAYGPPHRSIQVTLLYQSGFVKSETCQTDQEGWMNCAISIGGNSKEGEYEVVLTVDKLYATASFQVLSKENFKDYQE